MTEPTARTPDYREDSSDTIYSDVYFQDTHSVGARTTEFKKSPLRITKPSLKLASDYDNSRKKLRIKPERSNTFVRDFRVYEEMN